MAESTSNSQGTSQNTSTPVAVQTPQSGWGLQLSQLLGALTQNQYNWAQNQYNAGMAVTDQSIAHYMQLANQGAGLAQNLLGRYENVFEPLMNQYIEQAGTYNSEARQRFNMGQAESTAGQADQAAIDAATRQLIAYGVNPNSGEYADKLITARLQDAATRAGAGTQASVNTANTGRQMLQQAAQFGQNLPGMTVNALQSAYTGVGGAENAILGQLNTGANLMNTVPNFANAAANANRLPPVGQQSQGSSQQSSASQSQSPSTGNQMKPPSQSGQDGGGKGAATPPWNPEANANATANKSGLPNIPGAGTQNKEDQGNGDYATAGGLALGNTNPNDVPSWLNNPSLTDNPFGAGTPNQATSPDNTNWADPNAGQQLPFGTGQGPGTNPNGVSSNVDQFNMGSFPGQGGDLSSQAGINDIGSNLNQFQDNAPQSGGSWWGPTTSAQAADMPSGPGQQFPGDNFGGDQSQGGNYTPPDQSGGGNYGGDLAFQAGINDIGNNGGDYAPPPPSGGDYSGGFDNSGGGGGGYGGYAGGGVIPNRTSGGNVPRSASPSQGRRTDDIPARLNADEFVIPRDVKEHYGTKYFTDLIAKSRKARTGMAGPPPRGKMKPALRMRPTFTSSYMGNQ